MYSTTASNTTLSQNRISEYTRSSCHSNMYHVHNNGTNVTASKAYYQSRIEGTLADFDKQFGS
ncbi:hypothetical protein CMEL01_12357 [Colletotrichum melonis]|uniref:Uncharacterized protein n=1 Tax=Colletotrichum melonis TaxID=1209925 RepID=A0AAI9UUH8_9PEZI|nr:hypothetical protein CMEL01_12357 [Colletotrichum melonis]